MSAFTKLTLDLGIPSSGTLQTEKVAKAPPAKQGQVYARRSHFKPEASLREWSLPAPKFLSWQSERAWEVGIPQFGPI